MALPWVFAPPQGSPFGRGPAVGRRGGFHIRPRALRRRGVRRDEGIPPYGRPERVAAVRFHRAPAPVGPKHKINS